MSHICMSHVTHMNASWHTYECVMSHIWMRHVTHINASCHTYESVMSHMWMRHVKHVHVSCHTYGCVMSHIWIHHIKLHMSMRHVTHSNARMRCILWKKTYTIRKETYVIWKETHQRDLRYSHLCLTSKPCVCQMCSWATNSSYGVASISRLLKIIGLFCKKSLLKRPYSAKETYNFKEPTNRSHSISKI